MDRKLIICLAKLGRERLELNKERMRKFASLVLGVILVVLIGGLTMILLSKKERSAKKKFFVKKTIIEKKIEVSSPAFVFGETIPTRYTCKGKNINPPLKIGNLPEGTKNISLVIDDPDAPGGTWYHWLVYNIDPKIREIKEGKLPKGAVEVKNSFGYQRYGGPCPPPGRPHRYYFRVYALKEKLSLKIKDREELFRYLEKLSFASGELMGRFGR